MSDIQRMMLRLFDFYLAASIDDLTDDTWLTSCINELFELHLRGHHWVPCNSSLRSDDAKISVINEQGMATAIPSFYGLPPPPIVLRRLFDMCRYSWLLEFIIKKKKRGLLFPQLFVKSVNKSSNAVIQPACRHIWLNTIQKKTLSKKTWAACCCTCQ